MRVQIKRLLCLATVIALATTASAAQDLGHVSNKRIGAGNEPRPATSEPTEGELNRALSSKRLDERIKATKYLLDHPDVIPPMGWFPAIVTLLDQGNNEQAAFWYLIFQIRTQPWRERDPSGDGALYASISYTWGTEINKWMGSDRDAMVSLYSRAISYERKIPLYAGMPDGVSKTDWDASIERTRNDHSMDVLLKHLPEKDQLEAKRKQNGLYVGPWKSPGEPLHDDWQ